MTARKKTTTADDSTPLPLGERIARAEAEHRARVIQARQELEDGTAAQADVRARLEAAEEHVDDVKAGLRAGSDEVSPGDLRDAEAEVQGITLQAEGVKSRLDRARKAPTNSETDGALGLVPMVRDALPGVQVFTMSGKPPKVTEADVPAVILQQTEGSDRTDGKPAKGARGVEVAIHYIYGPAHRTLTEAHPRFERAARALDVRVDLDALRFGGTGRTVSARLNLATVKVRTTSPAPVPAITTIGVRDGIGNPVDSLAERVGKVCARRADLIHTSSTASIDGQSVDDDGIRRLTVAGTSTLREKDRPGTGSRKPELSDLHGEFVAGLGRIESVQETGRGSLTRQWSAVLVSRESHDVPHPEAVESDAA